MNNSDLIGSIGVFLILLAYFCNTFRLLSSRSPFFFALNAIGATLACLSSYLNTKWILVLLAGTWLLVSLIALIKVSRSNRY
jgi:hypothetical protein